MSLQKSLFFWYWEEEASFQICDASIFMYLKKIIKKIQLYALMMQVAFADWHFLNW